MDKFSYLSNASVDVIDEEFKKYKENPESVEFGWRKFFEGFEFSQQDYSQEAIPESFQKELFSFGFLGLLLRVLYLSTLVFLRKTKGKAFTYGFTLCF